MICLQMTKFWTIFSVKNNAQGDFISKISYFSLSSHRPQTYRFFTSPVAGLVSYCFWWVLGATSIQVMQQSSSEEYCGNEDWSICRVGYLRAKIVENPESGHAGSVTGVGWELRVKDKTELECVFSSSAFYVGVLPQMLEIISAAFFHKPFSAVSIPYLKVVDIFSHSKTLKKLFKEKLMSP